MEATTLAVSAYDMSSLWAQWVGSVAAVASVGVAIVFGYLTLANTRRSKDAQERATFAAATAAPSAVGPAGPFVPNTATGDLQLTVRDAGGERWELVNDGTETAIGVRIEGLTTLDRRRLVSVVDEPADLAPGASKQFVLVSRLALSGPANVVVLYRTQPDGPELRQVLLVPAP
jgi:hypothetical protein